MELVISVHHVDLTYAFHILEREFENKMKQNKFQILSISLNKSLENPFINFVVFDPLTLRSFTQSVKIGIYVKKSMGVSDYFLSLRLSLL